MPPTPPEPYFSLSLGRLKASAHPIAHAIVNGTPLASERALTDAMRQVMAWFPNTRIAVVAAFAVRARPLQISEDRAHAIGAEVARACYASRKAPRRVH